MFFGAKNGSVKHQWTRYAKQKRDISEFVGMDREGEIYAREWRESCESCKAHCVVAGTAWSDQPV